MTVPLAPDSTKRIAAKRFAEELRTAMADRGVGRGALAQAIGLRSDSIVAQWRTGNTLPRLESATALAEALDWPRLAELIREARTVVCDYCRKPFVPAGDGPTRYCSTAHRELAKKLRAGTDTRGRAIAAERDLALFRESVAQMCHGCEPEGFCRMLDCALRPVSPLPLLTQSREVRPVMPRLPLRPNPDSPVLFPDHPVAEEDKFELPSE